MKSILGKIVYERVINVINNIIDVALGRRKGSNDNESRIAKKMSEIYRMEYRSIKAEGAMNHKEIGQDKEQEEDAALNRKTIIRRG